jgi:hypothetical protein
VSYTNIPNPWRGGPYDPNAGLQNTTRSVPAGGRKAGIPSVITGSPQRIVWVADPVAYRVATINYGTFDFRPDLGAIGGNEDTNSVPLWRNEGKNTGICLWVYINGLQSTLDATTGLTVTATEFAHPITQRRMEQVKEPQDITTEFTGDKPAAALQCWPHGGSYPIRYWRLQLQFTLNETLSEEPAYYSMFAIY